MSDCPFKNMADEWHREVDRLVLNAFLDESNKRKEMSECSMINEGQIRWAEMFLRSILIPMDKKLVDHNRILWFKDEVRMYNSRFGLASSDREPMFAL